MSVHASGGALASPMDVMPLNFPIADGEVKYTFEEWNKWQGAWPEKIWTHCSGKAVAAKEKAKVRQKVQGKEKDGTRKRQRQKEKA